MFSAGAQSQVVINEILASNASVNQDEDGSHQDWVELYNPGPASVNLNGWGLTDDPTLPHKWQFPNVSMPANSYLLVWCSDKNRTTPGQPLHTNWKISASGEQILLTNASGTVVDSVTEPVQTEDISYGRLPNGTGPFVFFADVTPNAANAATGYTEVLPEPVFSHSSGFYTSAFNLSITSPVAGASIIYTLDGSEPTPENIGGKTYNYKNQYPGQPGEPYGPMLNQSYATLQYSSPLNIVDRSSQPNKIANISSTFDFVAPYIPTSPIFKGTVVKAKLVKSGALSGKTATRTFFVNPEGANRFSLPVISISINEDMLFDYEDGIYTAGIDFDTWRAENPDEDPMFEDAGNFHRSGSESERPAHFSYFVNGAEVLSQNIGLRVKGGSSRNHPSKSLNIYARSDYGNDKLEYPFFSDVPSDDFERIQLRNSGGDFAHTMFRDAMNQEICKTLRVERESYQPSIVFMNSEYWGILNIREKIDNNYFKQLYNIDAVDIMENAWLFPEIGEGDQVDWNNLYNYMNSNSLVSDANYNYIQTRIDTDNFIDYMVANIFLDNGDWPGTNVMAWRKKTSGFVPDALYGHDGRWRWAFHDTDDTYGITSDSQTRNSLAAATATNGPEWPNPPSSTLFLRKLLQNETFKNDFISRFADLLNTNFLPSYMLGIMEQMNEAIIEEIPEHVDRWKAPPSLSDRTYYLNWQTSFMNSRPATQRNHIRSKFGIASNINVNVDVSNEEHGYVKVNTIDIKDGTPGIVGNPYPWTGIYFSNIPVKLKAIALPGYEFDHWSGASNSTNEEITITMASGFSVTAHFVPAEPSATNQPIYFWMMDSDIPNDTPLTGLDATFEVPGQASIAYQSSLAGYPFNDTHPNWRKGSMERRNSPTGLNYIPEANENIPFETSNMRGLQITQPFQNGGLENTMIFNIPTTNYKNIKFAFAAKDENAADAIVIDYSTSSGASVWTSAGITSTLPLGDAYQVFTTDLSAITSANDNPDLKIRLRFTGANMTVDNGDRVTFNNISVMGTPISLDVPEEDAPKFAVYPNPASDVVHIMHNFSQANYRLFTIDGKLVKEGALENSQIQVSDLTNGIYMLQVSSGDISQTRKIIKK